MQTSYLFPKSPTTAKLDLKSPLTASTADSPSKRSKTNTSHRKLHIITPSTSLAKLGNSSAYFLSPARPDETGTEILHSAREMNSMQQGSATHREKTAKRPVTTQVAVRKTTTKLSKTLKIPGFSKADFSPIDAHYQTHVGDDSSMGTRGFLTTSQTKREMFSPSHDEYSVAPHHFDKFTNYFKSLNHIEARRSPLAKELFYYQDQLDLNKKFEDDMKKMRYVEDSNTFQLKTIKEGRKEKIDIPIGNKCFLKISCAGKTFPLRVRIDKKMGTFEMFVSKTVEKPDRQNCDFYFTTTSFEIQYTAAKEMEWIYFNINGSGNLKMELTMHFVSVREKPQPVKLVRRPFSSRKPAINPKRYEIYREGMNYQEERDFKDIIMQIKRERAEKLNRNIVAHNMETAAEYPRVKTAQLTDGFRKREDHLERNKEKRNTIVYGRKMRTICDIVRTDVKKIERNWVAKEELKAQQLDMCQRTWLTIIGLAHLVRNIKEKKSAVIAVRLIANMKANQCIRIQRKIRAHLAKEIHLTRHKHDFDTENERFDHAEAFTALNMFRALNAAALMSKKIQQRNAEKMVAQQLADFMVPCQIGKVVDAYVKRLVPLQKHWKQRLETVKVRVQIFHVYWQQFCNLLVSESKAKKKLQEQISKIRREHVNTAARKFVMSRLMDFKSVVQTFTTALAQTQEHHAAKPQAALPSSQSVTDISPSRKIKGGTSPKNFQKAENQAVSKTSVPEQKDEGLFFGKTKLRPSKEEFKEIFDSIIKELQKEGEL